MTSPALLTKEPRRFDSEGYPDDKGVFVHFDDYAALLAHVAALEQRVEAAEAAISNMGAALTDCGNYEAVLEQAAKDAIDELASAHGEYAELAAGNARRILDAALSQEPR